MLSHTFFLMCMLSIEWHTFNNSQYSTSHNIDFLFHIPCPSSSSPSHFFLLPRMVFFGNSSIVLMPLTCKWTSILDTCGGAVRFSFSPSNWQSMFRYGYFLRRKWRCPKNTNFFEFFNHNEKVSSKQWGQASPFLLLYLERLRWAGLSLMVVNNMACNVKSLH